jgi:hypothetical protein
MADSDPISSATRPHDVQPAGDADRRRQQSARRRRRRRRGKADDPEVTSKAPADGEDERGKDSEDESTERGPRGRHLDVRA